MSQEEFRASVYLVPRFVSVSFKVPGNDGASLQRLTTDETFQRSFAAAAGEGGSEATVDNCTFVDLGQWNGSKFLDAEMGSRIWLAVCPNDVGYCDFEGKYQEEMSSGHSVAMRNKNLREVADKLLGCLDMNGASAFLEMLCNLIDGKQLNGNNGNFVDELNAFYEQLADFVGSEYKSLESFAGNHGTLTPEVIHRVGTRVQEFKTEFMEKMIVFCDLWNREVNKPVYVLKEEFDELRRGLNGVGDGLVRKVDDMGRALSGALGELRETRARLEEETKQKRALEERLARVERSNQELLARLNEMAAFMNSRLSQVDRLCAGAQQCVASAADAQRQIQDTHRAVVQAYNQCFPPGH